MPSRGLSNVIDRLRKLASVHQAGRFSDSALLDRFVRQHDEAAFTALVERHGAMVLSVCRRVLCHQQDAEDACQATFLVLVRKARSIRKGESLASWLHGVAARVALKLRAQLARARRALQELPPAPAPASAGVTVGELAALLDEELRHLPEKYRSPLILCYLEARTRDEAAHQLGWSVSTLKGRLEYGRKLLRERLARRGLALSAVLAVAGLAEGDAAAAVPTPLVIGLTKTATQFAVGKPLAGLVGARVALLSDGILRAMYWQKLGQVTASCVAALMLLGGAVWMLSNVLAERDDSAGAGPIAAQIDMPVPPPKPDGAAAPGKAPDAEPDVAVRGAYLVNQVAQCGACHTPRTAQGDLDWTKHLQGADSWWRKRREVEDRDRVPDITRTGRLKRWGEQKLITFLTEGQKSHGPMPAYRLTLEDARAVAAYMSSLPGRAKGSRERSDDD